MRLFHKGVRLGDLRVSTENGCRRPFQRDGLNAKPSRSQNGSLPLTMVAPEKPVKLVEIMAGGRLRHRLTELGLTPGVELKVLQNKGGPLLLAVHNTRLALGRGMAHKIMVQAVSEDVASD